MSKCYIELTNVVADSKPLISIPPPVFNSDVERLASSLSSSSSSFFDVVISFLFILKILLLQIQLTLTDIYTERY